MIDKELFPKEYAAIERLKETSDAYRRLFDRRRAAKQKKIEECRRILNGEYTVGRDK